MANQTTYSDKLLDPRWQAKRLEILSRDKFTCRLCYDTRTTLHVHHEAYKGNPWDISNDKLKTLCSHCHDLCHKLPGHDVFLVEKHISLHHGCWQIVAHTDKGIAFVYMFFSDVENRSSLPTETIIIHTHTNAA